VQVVTGCPESVELSDGPIGGEASTRSTLASTSKIDASVPVGPPSAPPNPLSEPVGVSVIAVALACVAMAASSSEGSDAESGATDPEHPVTAIIKTETIPSPATKREDDGARR
jgi:hypothetical protein